MSDEITPPAPKRSLAEAIAPYVLSLEERSRLPRRIPPEIQASIFEMLEHIKLRPAMYVGKSDDVESLDHFLNGFGAGLFTHGIRHTFPYFHKAMRAHGYEISALRESLYEQMRERELSDEAIVQERMMLEIESWKIYFSEPELDTDSKEESLE